MSFVFNLQDEPWIPIADTASPNGIKRYGIRDVLLHAHLLGEIQCESPLATVGVLRLLLAILYRACGPATVTEWKTLYEQGYFPEDPILEYLNQWRASFDLFGDRPFYQVPGMVIGTGKTPISKLSTEQATGGQRLLFAWERFNALRHIPPADAALLLVEMQAFGLGGGISSNPMINDAMVERPNFEDAPVARSISLWLSGENLFDTLIRNLVPYARDSEEEDIPCWEQDNLVDYLSEPAHGPIDRYTWQSRLILLYPEVTTEGSTVIDGMFFTQGRRTDKEWSVTPDPMAIYFIADRQEGIRFLRLDETKAPWRDLHSMLAFDTDKTQRTPVLRHISTLIERKYFPEDQRFHLNIVGLVTDQASVSLSRHDRMSIPGALLIEPSLVSILHRGIEEAENVARDLKTRIRTVCTLFLSPTSDRKDGRKVLRADVDAMENTLNPEQAFWARMENSFYTFVHDLPTEPAVALRTWQAAVEREAREALQEACNQIGDSTRAIKAIANIHFSFTADKDARAALIAAAKDRKSKGGKKS